MAISPERREDLLREAKQYTRRAVFRHSSKQGQGETKTPETTATDWDVFVGLRESGAWALYVGEDPVLQFNPDNELRRLFYEGLRYRAQAGRLVRLAQPQRGGRLQLVEENLSPDDERIILSTCQASVQSVGEALGKELELLGSSLDDPSEFIDTMGRRMRAVAGEFRVAKSL